MTKDEELELLRQENAALRARTALVKEHLQSLQEQLGKDSHNSSLPPSSHRFIGNDDAALRQKFFNIARNSARSRNTATLRGR